MNILLDTLPIEVAGGRIRDDFRVFVLFEMLMKDTLLTDEEMTFLAINLCYEILPKDINEAVDGILWFYNGGRDFKEDNVENEEIYSFSEDQGLIFSAFLSEYNIDLTKEKLHWWIFRELFSGFKDDCMIKRVMAIRAMDTDSIKNDEVRMCYERLKNTLSLKKKSFNDTFLEGL